MKKISLLISLVLLLFSVNFVYAGSLYTYTGNGSLITYDADTLGQQYGAPQSSVAAWQDLTFDETDRLFGKYYSGASGYFFAEYNPSTLEVINQTAISGVGEIAAWGGILYTYTGNGSLITYNADTFEQLSGTAPSSVAAWQDVTFDETGRLFGKYYSGASGYFFAEYNPSTLEVINQTSISDVASLATRSGITAIPEPISSILFLTGGTFLIGRRYIKRKIRA
jgi:hypothetical protein